MEIYTTDLIEIALKHASIISSFADDIDGTTNQAIEDGCCNLQRELRDVIYERLSVAFNDIISRSNTNGFNLKNELFKTINEL